MIIDKDKAHKILVKAIKENEHLKYICPLCNEDVLLESDYLYCKSKLSERFIHLKCYNKLLKKGVN